MTVLRGLDMWSESFFPAFVYDIPQITGTSLVFAPSNSESDYVTANPYGSVFFNFIETIFETCCFFLSLESFLAITKSLVTQL